MAFDKYIELVSLRLDGELSNDEERELEEHLAVCPDCRAAGAQLAALQGAFAELEDITAPKGFAQGVMDRIRAEEKPKVVPLLKRPQFKALAGLAACLALVVGLYGASQPQKSDNADIMPRSASKDAVEEFSDVSGCAALTADEDVPQIAAYSVPEAPAASGEAADGISLQKSSPADGVTAYSGAPEDCAFQNDQYLWMAYDGDTPEPEARIIGSAQSLEDFLLPLPLDVPAEIQTRYSEAYFEAGRLLAVVVTEPSGSIRHQITQLTRGQVIIEQTSPYRTDDLAAWLILAEVDSTFQDGSELEVTVIPWEDHTNS
ncbi:MAG: zf-HC2 domain-containing protein [Lawsonibacter sp.]|nr:zf-HC2 domain-containing protein [Lawsonibacter sp.]